jgi:hypothetical protein
MGSVTWVQAAPKSITLCGPMCIMSKNALTPTAALHCNRHRNINRTHRGIVTLQCEVCNVVLWHCSVRFVM